MEVGANRNLSLLDEWCQPNLLGHFPEDFLRQPFPHTQGWNDITLKDKQKGWGAPYYDDMLWRGAMRIRNMGCESYHLLVVSGPERGNVWADERATSSKGIYPLPDGAERRVSIDDYLTQLG